MRFIDAHKGCVYNLLVYDDDINMCLVKKL